MSTGPLVEFIRTETQVQYVRSGPLVRYVCVNRTTSKVHMYEQDN